jgi:rhomboid family GlyGly-CTERM serine protease
MQSMLIPHSVARAFSPMRSDEARTREPQRREERREKGRGESAQTNPLTVTTLQVTETGLSLRSSRLCGLMGRASTAWSWLSARGEGASFASARLAFCRRPELLLFIALLTLFNFPVLTGSCWRSMIFQPLAVQQGEWWRLVTHPFVHVTWYHLLLDGAAFLALYHSLVESSAVRRLLYVLAAGAGSVLFAWATAPAISASGLCGLSGIAHGLMAVSALEWVGGEPPGSTERRIGEISFFLVVGKAALEALSGRMFFTFLHFGLMGDPVAVSHAGGVIGGLFAMLLLNRGGLRFPPSRIDAALHLDTLSS